MMRSSFWVKHGNTTDTDAAGCCGVGVATVAAAVSAAAAAVATVPKGRGDACDMGHVQRRMRKRQRQSPRRPLANHHQPISWQSQLSPHSVLGLPAIGPQRARRMSLPCPPHGFATCFCSGPAVSRSVRTRARALRHGCDGRHTDFPLQGLLCTKRAAGALGARQPVEQLLALLAERRSFTLRPPLDHHRALSRLYHDHKRAHANRHPACCCAGGSIGCALGGAGHGGAIHPAGFGGSGCAVRAVRGGGRCGGRRHGHKGAASAHAPVAPARRILGMAAQAACCFASGTSRADVRFCSARCCR